MEAHFARHVVRSTQMAIEKKGRLQCISGWLWCKFSAIKSTWGVEIVYREQTLYTFYQRNVENGNGKAQVISRLHSFRQYNVKWELINFVCLTLHVL